MDVLKKRNSAENYYSLTAFLIFKFINFQISSLCIELSRARLYILSSSIMTFALVTDIKFNCSLNTLFAANIPAFASLIFYALFGIVQRSSSTYLISPLVSSSNIILNFPCAKFLSLKIPLRFHKSHHHNLNTIFTRSKEKK